MIRLDHHTAPLSPNPKQSPDQKIISWDESRFLQDQDPVVSIESNDADDSGKDQPADAADKQADSTPANGSTPNHEQSSPLTPAEEEAPLETPQRQEEEEDDPSGTRQSTPLSELSPAPEEHDEQDEVPVEADKPPSEPASAPSPPQSNPSQPPESPSSTLPAKPPTHTTTAPADNLGQDPKAAALLELNAEMLKVLMFLHANGVPTNDPRFEQYSSRLEANLHWMAAAADLVGGQPGGNLPNMDPPSFSPPNSERVKELYSQLPVLFAKEIAKRQQMVRNPSSGHSMPGTPVIGGPSPSSQNLKRERPEDIVTDGIVNKRRDMGEGKSSSVPPTPGSSNAGMMPPPSAIPLSAQNSGNGSTQFSSQSMASSTSAGSMNGTSMNSQHQMPPRQSPLQHLSPQQQQHQQQIQMQPPPRPSSSMSASSSSTPLGPPSHPSQVDATLNMPGININNPSEAQMQAALRERTRQNQIRMAQQAAMRGGVGAAGMDQGQPGGMMTQQQQAQLMQQRQRQLHMQQQQQQQQQQQGGGSGAGMGGIDGSVGGGMMGGSGSPVGPSGMGLGAGGNNPGGPGGMNMGMGQNAGMMNGMGNMASGSNLAPGASRGGNMPPGAQGMTPQMSQQQVLQQMMQVLNTPGHPLVRYMIQNVPGFESMPMQQQVQRMVMAKNAMQQQNRQQELMQQGQMGGINRGNAPMPNAMQSAHMQQQMNAAGGGMSPPGGGFSGANMNSPMSPVQPQNAPNSMFGMGNGMGGQSSSGMGMGGGSSMGGSGGGMGMGGVGSMDPRMMGNVPGGMGGSGGAMTPQQISQQQQRQLLLMQQQRAAGGNQGMGMGGPGSGGGGGGGGGGMSGGMNPGVAAQLAAMGGMGAGNISNMPMMQQQLLQERMRQQQQQQQQKGQMNASSPTHAGSPMSASDFTGSSMRSGSAIPGIARSTRSPSDSVPSPLASRGAGQRSSSLNQEDYNRLLLQQQQQQAARAMSSQSPAFNQGMMGSSQQAAMLAAQQQHQGGSNFSMSPQNSANPAQFGGAGISAPSPTSGGQNWGASGQGAYPFAAGSPATSDHNRHMSSTPAPQQQPHITPQNTPPTDQIIPSDFDLFNWSA